MNCKICKKKISGRSDKIFCSINCKNYYHLKLREATALKVRKLDKILHRNRSILLEIMGKKNEKLKVPRLTLEDKKFQFKYHTHYHINSAGKIMHFVYDFGWMDFSDDEVLLVKVKTLG